MSRRNGSTSGWMSVSRDERHESGEPKLRNQKGARRMLFRLLVKWPAYYSSGAVSYVQPRRAVS